MVVWGDKAFKEIEAGAVAGPGVLVVVDELRVGWGCCFD